MQKSDFENALASEPVLNQEMLSQYRQFKTGLLERLMAAYLDEAPRYHAGLQTGMREENFEDVRGNAHALKSCSYNMGAARLSKLCHEIETSASAQDLEALTAQFEKLGPVFFEAEEALKGERAALGGASVSGMAESA